jgi:hypothetical protein
MDRMVWLFLAEVVALAALALVLTGMRQWRLRTDQRSRHCPHCDTPMSMRRISLLKSLLFLVAWECPHCGSRSRSRTGTAA